MPLSRAAALLGLLALTLTGCGKTAVQNGSSQSVTTSPSNPPNAPVPAPPESSATLQVDKQQTVYELEKRIRSGQNPASLQRPHLFVTMTWAGLQGEGQILEGKLSDGEQAGTLEPFVGIRVGQVPLWFPLGDDSFSNASREGLVSVAEFLRQYGDEINVPIGLVTIDGHRLRDSWWRGAQATESTGRRFARIGKPFPIALYVDESTNTAKITTADPDLGLFTNASGVIFADSVMSLRFPAVALKAWHPGAGEWTWSLADLKALAQQGRAALQQYAACLAQAQQDASQP